jgi:hypothetical protein
MRSSVATSRLEHGHEGPLLTGGVRGILIVVEVGEVVRLIVINLVEHLGAGHPAWGPVRVEDVRVRHPCNRPGAVEVEAAMVASFRSSPRRWAVSRAVLRTT